MRNAYYLIIRHILIYKTHVSKGAQSIHILCSVKLQFCNWRHFESKSTVMLKYGINVSGTLQVAPF